MVFESPWFRCLLSATIHCVLLQLPSLHWMTDWCLGPQDWRLEVFVHPLTYTWCKGRLLVNSAKTVALMLTKYSSFDFRIQFTDLLLLLTSWTPSLNTWPSFSSFSIQGIVLRLPWWGCVGILSLEWLSVSCFSVDDSW